MRRCLVIGASGLVGEHLVNELILSGQSPIFTFRTHPIPSAEQLDIYQTLQVRHFFREFRPEIVFLPAAWTNVDECEKNRELSYQTNVIGAKNVVDASNSMGARLIYFSTDYIFDGASGPYDETSVANPISEYGRQKLIAEHYIATTSSNFLIVRTTVVYGWERQGKNFIYRLVKLLREGSTIRVPMDQIGTPTYAPELAQNAIKLAKMDVQGVIHIAGANCINRYEFAIETAKVFGLPQDLVIPVSTKELNQLAERPLSAGLKTKKAAQLLQTSFMSSREGLFSLRSAKGQPSFE
jgi:dTDP-4-dehydrorhamnose reductase